MCGITGWVDYTGLGPDAGTTLRLMTETLHARGPDATGVWLSESAGLGHRRLAVIDIEGGGQPMTLARDGRTVLALTYSGELYNYRELRAELVRRGHTFTTASDTEVVLAAWHEWGLSSVDRFNGMYAFAVWDLVQRRLWLVRDRLGVKPLYYQRLPTGVLFGSEPKAVLAHPRGAARVDEEGLIQLMLPLLKVPGRSPYAELVEVRPGSVVRVDQSGVREHRYWRLERDAGGPAADSEWPSVVAATRDLLEDIVERQLVADVDLGTLLSGGLDSTAITALANKLGHEDAVRSFSVEFTAPFQPTEVAAGADGPYALEAAAHLGTDHTRIVLDGARLADPAARLACVRARDLPLGIGDLDMSLYALAQRIKQHSTVALSGESADEVFGGYLWFHRDDSVWADTFPWMADSPAHGRLHPRILRLFRPELRERLGVHDYVADQYRTAVAEVAGHPGEDRVERRLRELRHLGLTRFLPTLLDRKDRLTMAAGLEVRVPFCDHRLVELVHPLPWAALTADGREKSLLRAAVRDLLPESVATRRKAPYPSTPDPAYAAAVSGQLAARLADPACRLPELFAADQLRAAVDPVSQPGSLISNVGAEIMLNFDVWLTEYQPDIPL
ncbi:asparagine synthase (glutamine-hydrolyzing) [Goodfellowiella coeruleoviolacea]|uniref:asparagine synthase (glutamine-hydrolyzing) n=1 Tax=Goodfellowiella coeruleoviolacea TaxID=334858 RepID=A0AAE3KMM9_9PSEU|nr:asparagine synthase (glutamine-hydrolyzing) [Goodfellowiella coeruleoviolacea]MCP2167798.1 asparagine synthase (glutamine-hydrolyzing) [Goodfellowiella coeruleoviolacea]